MVNEKENRRLEMKKKKRYCDVKRGDYSPRFSFTFGKRTMPVMTS